jgi:hypothetical protein
MARRPLARVFMIAGILAFPGCQKPSEAATNGDHEASAPPPAPVPAPASPGFAQIAGWNGPAARAEHDAAGKRQVFHFAAPTAGYQVTLDGVAFDGTTRKVQLTLLQPAMTAVVAQVVTDASVAVDDAKLAGAEPVVVPVVVVVRRMQTDAHYFVAPPYEPALQQK